MSRSGGLGFGGFLVGLGLGWYIFTFLNVTANVFAWLLILAGAAFILSALFRLRQARKSFRRLTNGFVGGVILSLFLTSGIGFMTDLWGGGVAGPYSVEGTKTYSGKIDGNVYLEVNNFNGPVSVSSWAKAEYGIELKIKARGNSQQEAEKNLADFQVNFNENMVQDQKRLVLAYNIASYAQNRYSITVGVFLPAQAPTDLKLESSNGAISIEGIRGHSVTVTTTNGGLRLDDVYIDIIRCQTSNGPVTGKLEATDTSIVTSNGKVELTLPCSISGKYVLRTSNGPIGLKVSSSANTGFDLDMSTSNGNVNIDLPSIELSLNTRTAKRARTTGYDIKSIRIAITASTSNGSIDLAK
jgi:DUF4097 and DUF4098 domain-containing protein YvlB